MSQTPLSLYDAPALPELEQQQRLAVIAEALSWVGTPYHWGSDKKGVGIDCAMLLVRCWVDAGVIPDFDPRPYPIDWHLHAREERYLGWLRKYATETTTPRVGDVVVFHIGQCFSHGCILVRPDSVVHAHRTDRLCVRAGTNDPLFRRCRHKYYNLWAPPVASEA